MLAGRAVIAFTKSIGGTLPCRVASCISNRAHSHGARRASAPPPPDQDHSANTGGAKGPGPTGHTGAGAPKRVRPRRHRHRSTRVARRRAECLRGSGGRCAFRAHRGRDLGRRSRHDLPSRLASESRDRPSANRRTARRLRAHHRSADTSRVRVLGWQTAGNRWSSNPWDWRGAHPRRHTPQCLRRRRNGRLGAHAFQLRITRRLHGRRTGGGAPRRRER